MSKIYAALEIGTSRAVLAIGENGPNGTLRVLTHAAIPSTGVRKSQILDITQATESIHALLRKIETQQELSGNHVSIGNVILAVSGQHIQSVPYSASVAVGGAHVAEDDMNAALRAAHAMALPKERELLDIIDQDYTIDGHAGLLNPKEMAGRVLALNTLHVHADHNRIEDARTAANAVHLEIAEPVYAVTCAADAVLEEPDKRNGVLVIDFGGGSTSYAAYSDGYLVATGVLGVGGDHITNDIAHAFQTTNAQADNLKLREASATPVASEGEAARVRVDAGDSALMDTRTIARSALNTVVNARCMETLSILREMLEEQDLLHRLHAGIVLTGGGALLRNLDALVEQTFGTKTRIGRPLLEPFTDCNDAPSYATIAGALLYAQHNDDGKSFLGDILGRFF